LQRACNAFGEMKTQRLQSVITAAASSKDPSI